MPKLHQKLRLIQQARLIKKEKNYDPIEKENSSPMDLDKSFLVTNDSLSRDDYVSLSQDVFDSTFQNASNVYPQDILDHSSVNTIDQTNMAELSTKAKQIRIELINKINDLDEKELIACSQLFENMQYPNGTHQGKILSPYLQKKAMEWVLMTKGKPQNNESEINQKMKELEKEIKKLKKKIENLNAYKKSLAIKEINIR
ncbi:12327_t:CDS:2 [Entrophospora sp. SA101]|nr:12327_t:CDS:2 [Entrophospora sp. SA101]